MEGLKSAESPPSTMGRSNAGQIPGVADAGGSRRSAVGRLAGRRKADSTELSAQIEQLSRQVEELSPQIARKVEELSRQVEELSFQIEQLEQRIKLAKQKIEGLERQGAADKDQLVALKHLIDLHDQRRGLEDQLRALEKQLAARYRFVLTFQKDFKRLVDLLGSFESLKVKEVPIDGHPPIQAHLRTPVIS